MYTMQLAVRSAEDTLILTSMEAMTEACDWKGRGAILTSGG